MSVKSLCTRKAFLVQRTITIKVSFRNKNAIAIKITMLRETAVYFYLHFIKGTIEFYYLLDSHLQIYHQVLYLYNKQAIGCSQVTFSQHQIKLSFRRLNHTFVNHKLFNI